MTDKQAYAGLLPCPFCGHSAVAISDNGRGLMFNVHCGKCRASGPWERCADDAKDAWNARPEAAEAISSLLKRVGELEGVLAECLEQAEGCFANHYDHGYEDAPVPEHIAKARAALNSDAPLSIGEGL